MTAMDAEAITRILGDVLGVGSFDADTLSYMASIVEDEPAASAEQLWEMLGDFIRDAGTASDGDDAAGLALCAKLAQELRPGEKLDTACAGYPAARDNIALNKPVTLSALLEPAGQTSGGFAEVYGAGDGSVKGGLDELPQEHLKVVSAVSKAKKEKVARRAERKLWRAEAKTEDDAVWVDLPSGCSLATSGSGTAVDFHLDRYTLPNKKGSGELLNTVSCTFAQGRRYGILGRNGCGKSTLLDAIAKREISSVPSCSIFYVRQEVEGDDRKPLDWVLQANSERQMLISQKEALERDTNDASAGVKLSRIYQRLQEIDGDEAHLQEKRAEGILAGLGFDSRLKEKATKDLSGGWRMRVALACALFVSPGLLLLDEPTNHLDLETVIWLENYLNTDFHQTLLVVSHDRMFLNEVVSDIVLFEREKLDVYKGDYRAFEKIRQEHRVRQERLREQQEMKREHLQDYITKHAEAGNNGCKAAAQRKARMRKLERLGMEAQASIEGRKMKVSYDGTQEEVDEVQAADSVELDFPDPGVCDSLGNPLLRFDSVEFGYGDSPALFTGLNLSIDQASRIAILGKNGTGKSTLLKLLLGKLKPRFGLCSPHRGARIQYVAQHHLEELDGESKPLDIALERFPGDGSMTHQQRMRQYLGHFGLGGEVLPFQKVRTLSGGQKFRVSLAMAMYCKPHLLVLDEPTNHLDMETIDALVEALCDFKGGFILVSHDEHLIGSACKDLYVLEKKSLVRFPGSISEYKKKVLASRGKRSA
eukprot:TRINITY_DN24064_c0_g1_i1.p1 TRINITY_DN24064_c0_g1~~TRINITY_DN24064_c0_g1_i1.p1  ORF type:complete len:763 (-),score=140.70 TRINITY_DN24064_c0_g1_i1:41-2329(-)